LFVTDCSAWGLRRRVTNTFRKDGGLDILFWPRLAGAFPFLGAAQVKYHRNALAKVGAGAVRDFAGALACQAFGAALLVTNTGFSPDAEWFERERAKLLRLRGLEDIRRWIENNFSANEECREIPSSIELCPGTIVKVRE
jgi:hypothetical protein